MVGLLIICLLWIFYISKSNFIRVSIIFFLLTWQGLPAFNIWQANRLVDDLCHKDGLNRVYETVTLPPGQEMKLEEFILHDKKYIGTNDAFYSEWKAQIVKGDLDYRSLFPRVTRMHYLIRRTKDEKVMAEFISYVQAGGESPGFSLSKDGHSCPHVSESALKAKVFIKENS